MRDATDMQHDTEGPGEDAIDIEEEPWWVPLT